MPVADITEKHLDDDKIFQVLTPALSRYRMDNKV